MKQNKFGELIFTEDDLVHSLMSGVDLEAFCNATVDIDKNQLNKQFFSDDWINSLATEANTEQTVEDYDAAQATDYLMPDYYKTVDIAELVLGMCNTDEQLQRAGQELIMFQERNMFPLLQYMHFLVDTMRENNIIWGVGRGSSVASYVLYLIGVHRIDSIYYNLDIEEFLR